MNAGKFTVNAVFIGLGYEQFTSYTANFDTKSKFFTKIIDSFKARNEHEQDNNDDANVPESEILLASVTPPSSIEAVELAEGET